MAANVDQHNRKITYLRVSVTDRCNLRCIYCMPVRDFKLLNHDDILRYEDIFRALQAAAEIGIEKVRLTGGEPLVRRNFVDLVECVCQIPGLKDVSITTNGVLLKKMAQEIFDAGVHRINVSLDTLNPEKYAKIAGRDCFHQVWEGLQETERVGFWPIKVNVVALRGINDDELFEFARLSVRKPYHIRFIEHMPIGHDTWWRPGTYMPVDEMKFQLATFGPLGKIPQSKLDGPAERYRFESAEGEIGFISGLSHHFCLTCNRLRLTADGKLRPCLFSDDELDIRTPLRNGCSQEDLKKLFHKAVSRKSRQHHAKSQGNRAGRRPMSAIGG
jgi:cyclic pyranopterin phosphate synthase